MRSLRSRQLHVANINNTTVLSSGCFVYGTLFLSDGLGSMFDTTVPGPSDSYLFKISQREDVRCLMKENVSRCLGYYIKLRSR